MISTAGSRLERRAYADLPYALMRNAESRGPAPSTVCIDREALFAEFAPLVNRLIRQYGRTFDMRMDLVGEFYCLFHTLLDRYDPERGIPLRPYLVRQMSATAFTMARKQWRLASREAPTCEALDLHDAAIRARLIDLDPTPLWDAAMVQSQLAGMLPALIQELPCRQRQVLIMRYYEDRPFEEIARLLEIETSSVRSLLRHALNKVRLKIAQ